jgi:hypothetical protein
MTPVVKKISAATESTLVIQSLIQALLFAGRELPFSTFLISTILM